MENKNLQLLQHQVAEIQLSYKSTVKPSLRPKITCSKDAYDVLLQGWDASKLEFIEQFKVLLLNRANKVLGIFEVSSGGSTGTVADPKLIFAAAIKANACGIIMTHYDCREKKKPGNRTIYGLLPTLDMYVVGVRG